MIVERFGFRLELTDRALVVSEHRFIGKDHVTTLPLRTIASVQSDGMGRQNIVVTTAGGERYKWIIGRNADKLRDAILAQL